MIHFIIENFFNKKTYSEQVSILENEEYQMIIEHVGHVRSWDGQKLEMTRDAAANGSRPEQRVTIPADEIVTIKPVPERSMTRPRP